MQYNVILTDEAKEDLKKLETHLQDKLIEDYKTVKEVDIDAVVVIIGR